MRLLLVFAAIGALVGAAILVERMFPSEEERVLERAAALVNTVEEEDLAAFESALSPSFRFEGVIGSGDRERAIERARRLFEEPQVVRFRIREQRAEAEGDRATVELGGWARYGVETFTPGQHRWDGFMGRYRVRLVLVKGENGVWLLESAEIREADFEERRPPEAR